MGAWDLEMVANGRGRGVLRESTASGRVPRSGAASGSARPVPQTHDQGGTKVRIV